MPRLLDAIYLIAALVTSPIWLFRLLRTGKIRTDWPARFGRTEVIPASGRRRALLHAVSVGEVNAIRKLVERLAAPPISAEVVVAATTDTGLARAKALFGERHHVVRYPLDFSFAVRRFLDAVRPDVAGLVELEIWPNFILAAERRGIPVFVINGRLTARSARGYRLLRPYLRSVFRRLVFAAVQNRAYADRFAAMGVPAGRLSITGTMKWDGAEITDHVDGAEALAESMGIDRGRPLIVAGSTAPGEHELLAEAVGDGVQLLCAPRRPEWFDRAAEALPGCARRTLRQRGSPTGRFLLDTIGELRSAYALADVVVVGRSFGTLHGSDMMEPAALGKATVVGPAVADFRDTVEALLRGDGIVQTDRQGLATVLRELLASEERRRRLGENARRVIKAHQGATLRNAELIAELLEKGTKAKGTGGA